MNSHSFLTSHIWHSLLKHSGPAVHVSSRWYRSPGNGTDLLCATHKVDSSTHHVTSTSAPLLNQPTKSVRLCFLRHGFSLSSPFLALLPSWWLHNLVSCFPPLHLWTLLCWGNYLWIYFLYWRTPKPTSSIAILCSRLQKHCLGSTDQIYHPTESCPVG